jgi:polyphosphate glucokinase
MKVRRFQDLQEESVAKNQSLRTLSIDLGGSGIKAIVLNETGETVTERSRVKTPRPATPDSVLKAIAKLAAKQEPFDRVSMGFPGVMRNGVAHTAHNLDDGWIGFDIAGTLGKQLGKPVRVANDADIQGWAAVEGQGVELVITLGTGLGSALFLDGKLVPNLELGHHPFRKSKTYEDYLGRDGYDKLGIKKWNRTLEKAILTLEQLFNYDRLYVGGGNAKKIRVDLPENVTVVPNTFGLIGGIALWREELKGETASVTIAASKRVRR